MRGFKEAFIGSLGCSSKRNKVYSSEEEICGLDVSTAFFREESRVSRDLAVLAAEIIKPNLIVDAFAGAGTRALRYARDVSSLPTIIANEPNPETGLAQNVASINRVETRAVEGGEFLRSLDRSADIVDADSFGLGLNIADAVSATKDGGICIVTTTGAAAAGARGEASRQAMLARLGCTVFNDAAQNELGLRALLGRTAAAAANAGDAILPVYATYDRHGPVFRVATRLVRKRPGALGKSTYNRARSLFFASYCYYFKCNACGHTTSIKVDELGKSQCANCANSGNGEIAGPLWTGPLHDPGLLYQMQNEAQQRGWLTANKKHAALLARTFHLLLAEVTDPRLHFSPPFISLDDIGQLSRIKTPSLEPFKLELERNGFAAASTQFHPKGCRTNAPMSVCQSAACKVVTEIDEETKSTR